MPRHLHLCTSSRGLSCASTRRAHESGRRFLQECGVGEMRKAGALTHCYCRFAVGCRLLQKDARRMLIRGASSARLLPLRHQQRERATVTPIPQTHHDEKLERTLVATCRPKQDPPPRNPRGHQQAAERKAHGHDPTNKNLLFSKFERAESDTEEIRATLLRVAPVVSEKGLPDFHTNGGADSVLCPPQLPRSCSETSRAIRAGGGGLLRPELGLWLRREASRLRNVFKGWALFAPGKIRDSLSWIIIYALAENLSCSEITHPTNTHTQRWKSKCSAHQEKQKNKNKNTPITKRARSWKTQTLLEDTLANSNKSKDC